MSWPKRTYVYDPASKNRPRPKGAVILTGPPRVEVLRFIRDRVWAGNGFPTYQEIAQHMGWRQLSTARETLRLLAAEGYLAREPDKRGTRIGGRAVWKLVG